MRHNSLYGILAYAGALPFVACALLLAMDIAPIDAMGRWASVAAGYGLAIAAFMAGVHWGIYLQQATRAPVNLLLTSNAVTVIVWLTFVLAPVTISLAVTAIAFIALLLVDYRLAGAELISASYLQLRRNVTLLVLSCLLLMVLLT